MHAEGGGLIALILRQSHLGEELIPTPPGGLHALEGRPIFKAPPSQAVIEVIDLHNL